MTEDIHPLQLLEAYAAGYFPMAENEKAEELYWFNPEERSILPLENFHIPRSLEKQLKKCPYRISVDEAFREVMTACAAMRGPGRNSTWINSQIIDLYTQLHEMGYAHSVEVWEEKEMVGGLYGVSLLGAFFGESMFSKKTNASKFALVHLVERMRKAGYEMLDAQFENDHLKQFGFITVSKEDYLSRLRSALSVDPNPSNSFCTVSPSKS